MVVSKSFNPLTEPYDASRITTSSTVNDPSDPMCAMTETFVRSVKKSMIDAMKATIFRELPKERKLQSFMLGTLVGVVSLSYKLVPREQHEVMFKILQAELESARRTVEYNEYGNESVLSKAVDDGE